MYRHFFKRLIDFIRSFVALLILSPILIQSAFVSSIVFRDEERLFLRNIASIIELHESSHVAAASL